MSLLFFVFSWDNVFGRDKKMKYYLVTAKCGHVGRGKFLEIAFPIYAMTKSDAAQICLKKSKVKKQLKNAISSVYEISFDEYRERMISFKDNGYIRAHTKKEIIGFLDEVQTLDREKKWKKSFSSRQERIEFVMKKNKIMEKLIYA